MRYLILFMFAAGIFVLGSRSCGNNWAFGFGGVRGKGPVKTENRKVSDFHAIDAQISGLIEVRTSDQYSVEVDAQENLLAILKTEVKNGTLKIYFDKNVWGSDDLVIRVSAPSYDALALAGSGHFDVKSTLRGEKLKLSVAGSGEIDLPEADVNNLNCEIAGSGDIEVGGHAATANYSIAGSGDIHAKQLAAEEGKAEIAGSGAIHCRVTQRLKASIAGSGDIYYAGSPSVDTDISGSGSVKHVEGQ